VQSGSFSLGRRRVDFAGATDVGRVRAHNEDNFVVHPSLPLGVIADGMGGHASGEVASEIAVQTAAEFFTNSGELDSSTFPFRFSDIEVERARMTSAVKLANSKIYETAQADAAKRGMGCTIDAIFFARGRFYVGHVGDSRVYRVRAGQLTQITEDHSLLNDFKRMKEMSGQEVENFQHKNVVVRALGLTERVAVDIVVDEFAAGDLFLLCSDGLTDMVSDEDVARILGGPILDLEAAASQLVAAANQNGGKDNITALLARVHGD
jgi:protein phosphatase